MERKYVVKSASQTQKLGAEFANELHFGDSVLLKGELGVGKTTFVQGVAKALKIRGRIISPTFVLVRKHTGKLRGEKINLYHVDLYRINDLNTVIDLGLTEIFEDENGIVFIEWGEKSKRTKFKWEVKFEILGKNERKVSFKKQENGDV